MSFHQRRSPIKDDDSRIEVPRQTLQILLDTAINSMDFGSGFLCDEEVQVLRAVAALLDVDPIVATPDNYKCRFQDHAWDDGWQENPDFPGAEQPAYIKGGPRHCSYCRVAELGRECKCRQCYFRGVWVTTSHGHKVERP